MLLSGVRILHPKDVSFLLEAPFNRLGTMLGTSVSQGGIYCQMPLRGEAPELLPLTRLGFLPEKFIQGRSSFGVGGRDLARLRPRPLPG